jgi:orotidine-5'-phosphate decarboxylase
VNSLLKLSAAQQRLGSPLCIGLDPEISRLPAGISRDPSGVFAFCREIVQATQHAACAYKANLAYFLALGVEGVGVLNDLLHGIPSQTLTILDAKFSDIDHSAARYAAFAFEQLKVDAVTLNPYVGTDSIRPFVAHTGKLSFVLCRTSNLEGNEFQVQKSAEAGHAREPLYEQVARQMVKLAGEFPHQLGLVVGATQPDELARVRSLAPDLPFLVPGVGAQGGELEPTLRFGTTNAGILPLINVGRAVLYASSGHDYAAAARAEVDRLLGQVRAWQQGAR